MVFHRHCIEAVIDPPTTHHERRNALKRPVGRKDEHVLRGNKHEHHNRTRERPVFELFPVPSQNECKVQRLGELSRKRSDRHLHDARGDFDG